MIRKIKLFIACSLDGFIAREDESVDWLFTGDYGYAEFYNSIDTVLMGRKTYEISLQLGDFHKNKKIYVFTKQKGLKKLPNVEFISDAVDFTKKLIKSKGKDVWLIGVGEIVSVLLNNNLIDEIILYVHPIIIGNGIPLFKNIRKEVKLKFIKCVSYKDGLVQIDYKVLK